MPELPEMENYCALLTEKIQNQRITDVVITRPKSINVSTSEFISKVKGQTITSIQRRAKYLIFHLQNGHSLLLHLMLGGWMFYGKEEEKPKRTIQVQLSFGEYHLYFYGLLLGYLHIHPKPELPNIFSPLGPEPLLPAFILHEFQESVKQKRGILKTALLDQGFLAGIGNRYSDEICFQAGLHPERHMDHLLYEDIETLYHAIHVILKSAIKHGGYMEHPFSSQDRLTGGYLNLLKVHGKENDPCKRCGNPIEMEELSSRKTYFCGHCQK